MPLLDSFTVDHKIMQAPAVRIAKDMSTPKRDKIRVFDLRFTRPNIEILDEAGIHTMEHLFAGFMRNHLKNFEVIDISPMGCRTGFYMSVIGQPNEQVVANAWLEAMQDVLNVESQDNIPELNEYQCGNFKMHSLANARQIAKNIISQGISINLNEELKLSEKKLAELGN